jgi:HD-like signal output (HDOD) protein
MQNEQAKATMKRVSDAMQSGQIAGMPELVRLIQTLSSRDMDVAVEELATLISRDAIILTKVLAAANTFGYNPAGIRISSVSQAVHHIGYDRVRRLATSLLLLENAQRSTRPDEQREATALALCSGIMAKTLAGKIPSQIDPEHAFICAALRNFGRIVITHSMLDDYRRATALSEIMAPDDAFREVFGLTPLELGYNLLQSGNVPEEILVALRECQPEKLESAADTHDNRLLGLSDYAMQLADIVFNPKLTAAEFAAKTHSLNARFEKLVPGVAEVVGGLLDDTEQELARFMRSFNIRTLPTHSLLRLKQRRLGIDPVASRDTPPSAPGDAATPTRGRSRDLLRLEELALLCATPDAETLPRLIAGLRDSLAADECWLFSRYAGTPEYRLTHGLGARWQELRPTARLREGERTVLGLCLARKENILIHDATAPTIQPHLPAWLRDHAPLGAFVLLPMHDLGQCCGLIIAGWRGAHPIALDAEHALCIRRLLAAATPLLVPATAIVV